MDGDPEKPEPCDVCGAHDSMRPYLTVSLAGVFDAGIRECERCGFRQVRPRVTPEELAALYPPDYFDPRGEMGFRDYARMQQRHERDGYFLARRLRRIAKTGRLLEVGCALGFLLDSVKRHTDWEVEGLDVAAFAAGFARRRYGLNVQCTTLEQAQYPDDRFDFVVQKDVLEHVLRPRDHLRETHRIMRPGGTLWLITPNGEANLRPLRDLAASPRCSGTGAVPLLDQGHLSFFSRENLVRIASESGFTCDRFRHIGLRRGLRALGVLPRKRRAQRTAPGGRTRRDLRHDGAGPAAGGPDGDRLYERMSAEVDRARTSLRCWPPYMHFRRAARALGSLPGPFALGHDFELFLKKT